MQKIYKVFQDLHEYDKQIANLREKIHEIPLLIKNKQNTINYIIDELAKAKSNLKKQKATQHNKETELQDIEDKISDCNTKRWKLKSNKELQALQNEISSLEDKKDSLQNDIIQFLCSEEEEQSRIKDLERKQKQEGLVIEQDIKKLTKELEEYNVQLKEITEKRDLATKILDDDIRERYFKILRNRDGIATSYLSVHSCTQCGIRVRPQIINEIRSQKNICFCESCNRILLYKNEEDSDN